MSTALGIWYAHCRSRTGSGVLLSEQEKRSIEGPIKCSDQLHRPQLTVYFSTFTAMGNRHQRDITNAKPLNPHSSLTTNKAISPQPRGFLP